MEAALDTDNTAGQNRADEVYDDNLQLTRHRKPPSKD